MLLIPRFENVTNLTINKNRVFQSKILILILNIVFDASILNKKRKLLRLFICSDKLRAITCLVI